MVFYKRGKREWLFFFFSELNLFFDKVKLVYIYNVILENVVVDIIKFSFSIHRANAELAKNRYRLYNYTNKCISAW